jgi:hypothetical protein
MDMLGHDNVSVNAHHKTGPHHFETIEEEVTDFRRVEVRSGVITAESQEMRLSRLLEAAESAGHAGILEAESQGGL